MKWGVRNSKAFTNSGKIKRKELSDIQKTRIKKGAKFAGKVLVGAAATYAVIKIPRSKSYNKGVAFVAERAIKPIPGTKYLARQAQLADRINVVSDYASIGAAAGMAGTTAYKFGKKYKVSVSKRTNDRRR